MTSSTTLVILTLSLLLPSSPLLSMAQNEGDIRLVGMNNNARGRVEVYYNKTWGTLCDHNYGGAANTICYQLNFKSPPSSHNGTSAKYLDESNKAALQNNTADMPIHFRDIDCGPIYSNPQSVIHLLRCDYVILEPDSECNHEHDLVVFCNPDNEPMEDTYLSEVRLVRNETQNVGNNITFASSGTLEIYLNKTWGNLCYTNFSQSAANTSCQQLGYTHAADILRTNITTADVVWFDNLTCENKSYACINSCFDNDKVKNSTCSDGIYAALNCSFDPKLDLIKKSGNPTKCMLRKRYSKVPAYFYGIMSGAGFEWLVSVGIILMTAVCYYNEKCPCYRWRKGNDYITIG